MCAQEVSDRRPAASQPAAALTWLGGGHWGELTERHERSTHAVAGAVVLLGTAVAGLVAAAALAEATRWPAVAVAAVAVLVALLAGAVVRGTVAGPRRSHAATVARAGIAAIVGACVGEFALLVMLSGPIDHRVTARAAPDADATPAVAETAAALRRAQDARHALDSDVDAARERQDKALVVARCEYHPSPGCPQTRITGVPGAGPEARTANDSLADAQQELTTALAVRDSRAPELDAEAAQAQRSLDDARRHAMPEPGLGARWIAMNDVTLAGPGPLILRVLTDASCALLFVLPLLLAWWRGETTQERRAAARAERERAELDADTAIAVRRAEVRREAEILWAEHQLTQARLAVEAQLEIDREHQRRRVSDALDAPLRASSQRPLEPTDDDVYLPIAAAAEAASRAAVQLPAESPAALTPEPPAESPAAPTPNLPAPAPAGEVQRPEPRAAPSIPSIPDVTKVAARWLRPLIPPLVARVVDTTTHPLRSARHVVEEVLEETEEITFAFKRTRKVRVSSESSGTVEQSSAAEPPTAPPAAATGHVTEPSGSRRIGSLEAASLGAAEDRGRAAVSARTGPAEIGPHDGPRQLPPAT